MLSKTIVLKKVEQPAAFSPQFSSWKAPLALPLQSFAFPQTRAFASALQHIYAK